MPVNDFPHMHANTLDTQRAHSHPRALTLTGSRADASYTQVVLKIHAIGKSRGAPTSLSQFGGFVQFVTVQGGEQGVENRAGALSVQLSLVPYA
eukprot:COSAG02_NODE_7065_length_3201_cov_2.020954_4_plen_94_part_00